VYVLSLTAFLAGCSSSDPSAAGRAAVERGARGELRGDPNADLLGVKASCPRRKPPFTCRAKLSIKNYPGSFMSEPWRVERNGTAHVIGVPPILAFAITDARRDCIGRAADSGDIADLAPCVP
jgi:hypothetical protein